MKVNFKVKHLYIIEYRFWGQATNQWISKISQEGYIDIEEARNFCRERAHNEGTTENPMYFQNITSDGVCEEYYIKEITFKDFSET